MVVHYELGIDDDALASVDNLHIILVVHTAGDLLIKAVDRLNFEAILGVGELFVSTSLGNNSLGSVVSERPVVSILLAILEVCRGNLSIAT